MKVRGLKTYRCGDPGPKGQVPPAAIEKLMVKHLGARGRIFPGGKYPQMPNELGSALVKDKAAEEF